MLTLFAFLRSVPSTLTLVVMGIVFALALDPVVSRLERKFSVSRGLAVAGVGIVALCGFATLVALVGPSAVEQAARTSRDLPQTIDKLVALPLLGDLLVHLDAQRRIGEWIQALPEQLSDQSIADIIESVVGGVSAGLTVLVVGLATLLEGPSLLARLRALVPAPARSRADTIGRVFHNTVGAYFAGSLLVASLASMFVLVLGLSLGVPLTPVAAVWVLIVNFIPQVGGLLAASMLTVLALGKSPGTAVLCLVVYWVYMILENHVIQPIVVGNAVNLSTAATMLAMLIGGTLFGVPGAILGAPIVGTAKGLYVELRHPDRMKALQAQQAAQRRHGLRSRLHHWVSSRRRSP